MLVYGQAYTNTEAAALLGIPVGKPARRSAFELGGLEAEAFFVRMTDHDTELVALIDNELESDAKARLLARLAEDEPMRERHDALREAGRSITLALHALLQQAPLPQLRAYLPP